MNKKLPLISMLALALLVIVTLGCGTSPTAEPQPEKADAPEIVATEMVAPTLTPEPVPDLSTARISLSDLPPGFEEIPMDDELLELKASEDGQYSPEVFFAFVNGSEFQVIMGMNFLLLDTTNRLGFGFAMNDAEDSLKEFAGALGGQNIREVKTLPGMDGLGDEHHAITMLADVEGIPMRVDAAMFQRDIVGGIILFMRIEGEQSILTFRTLTELLDLHIQESLRSAE